MTPLRQKMIDDLKLRNYSDDTVRSYVFAVRALAKQTRRPPDSLGIDDIRAYLLHLIREKKPSWSWYNVQVCGLRFFYRVTLQRDWIIEHVPYGKRPQKVAVILSRDEVVRFLEAIEEPCYRVALTTIYAAGLRVSEALALVPSDIDSARMLLLIREGKGQKQRLAPLSPTLLDELRAYYRAYRPTHYLFFGKLRQRKISERALRYAAAEGRERAGIKRHFTLHHLRASFATHLLEAGVELNTIRVILGHAHVSTTERYAQVRANLISATQSPLDLLDFSRAATGRRT